MEETKKKNKSIKSRKTFLIIVVFLVVMLIVCAIFGFLYSNRNEKKIEISNTMFLIDYNEYLGYSAVVVGTAKNVGGKKYSYVSVEFSVYDSFGNNLGTAFDNIKNLFDGDTWRFEAKLPSYTSTPPASYKLVEIVALE